jgi:hypothetical protein
LIDPRRWPAAAWAAGAVLFVVLATANGAGYRYGVSDQAFYIPAILHALDPATFPRDAALIDSQARLMLIDEAIAGVMRATGLSMQALFAAGYFLSLLLIWTALTLIGGSIYRNAVGTAALAAAVTLRHRITRTSANSLEPYFYPRMLAFGIGALAIAAVLRRRSGVAIALVAVSGAVHITTGLWFAALVGTALIVIDRRLRPVLLVLAGACGVAAVWALAAGPLRDARVTMDGVWLQAVAGKDSLFASQWPAWAWLVNLATAGILGWAYAVRRRRGLATPADTGLLAGAGALLALFLLTLPAVAAGVAFFVQLQIARVFWLIDFLALIYALAVIPRRPLGIAASLILAASIARGTYILQVEFPERTLFAFDVPRSAWTDAMGWLRAQPVDTHVLADPGHAWKYGTSVRVMAGRDVYLEDVKDSALAMYSREVAVRVVERMQAIGDFASLTEDGARGLATRFDLDYLVTPAALRLPVAYRNDRFTIYAIGGPQRPALPN